MLRWKQFIQSEFDSFIVNTKKFVEQTGVKIRVDAESWDDIRPKAAVAANVGGGSGDMVVDASTTRSNSPTSSSSMDRLISRISSGPSTAARCTCCTRKYGMLRDRWIALPQGSPVGTGFNYRAQRDARRRLGGFPQGHRWVP